MIALPMKRSWLVPAVLALVTVVAGPLASARAGVAAPGVSLAVSPRVITYGQWVHFSGRTSLHTSGQVVRVVDGQGDVVARATTSADGSYHAARRLSRSMVVHAEWTAVRSRRFSVGVRPRLTASRTAIRLFDTTVVTGALAPHLAGSHINVTLWRGGNPVERFRPVLLRAGTFRVGIKIRKPGQQSVVVRFKDGEHIGVAWRSAPETPPLPALGNGSSGIYVRLLEHRLAALHYRVFAFDGRFDYHDGDSILAFHKVQGMARTSSVDRATWYALASPKVPVLRGPRKGNHFEVDLTKQVVYYVQKGRLIAILHTSTGKPSTPTRPGDFHVWSKQPGTNAEGMYYSSFFDGNRALHGYPEVPPYAASHGCVRLPFWHARWVYDRAPIGIEVLVYNS